MKYLIALLSDHALSKSPGFAWQGEGRCDQTMRGRIWSAQSGFALAY